MTCILIFYILFWISHKLSKDDNLRYLIIFSLIYTILSLLFKAELYFEQSFSFLIGVIFAKKENPNKFLHYKYILSLFILGIIALLIKQTAFIRNGCFMLFFVCQLLIKCPIGLSIILYINKTINTFNYEVLYSIGKCSYFLYLIHFYLLIIMLEILNFGFGFILLYIVGIIFLLCIYTIVQRMINHSENIKI